MHYVSHNGNTKTGLSEVWIRSGDWKYDEETGCGKLTADDNTRILEHENNDYVVGFVWGMTNGRYSVSGLSHVENKAVYDEGYESGKKLRAMYGGDIEERDALYNDDDPHFCGCELEYCTKCGKPVWGEDTVENGVKCSHKERTLDYREDSPTYGQCGECGGWFYNCQTGVWEDNVGYRS